jgi:hypothetical protein
MFTPTRYVEARAEYLRNFFTTNHYVEYSLCRNLSLEDPQRTLPNLLGGRGYALSSVYLGQQLVDEIDANLCEEVRQKKWAGLHDHMPTSVVAAEYDQVGACVG